MSAAPEKIVTSEALRKHLQSRRASRMPTREGFIYEPRAFWSFGRIETSAVSSRAFRPQSPLSFLFNREHFYNGEKYPVTLLYMIVAPLNYTFDQYAEAGNPPDVSNFRNCTAAVANWTQLVLGVRQRQHYIRIPSLNQIAVPRPRWDAEPRNEEHSALYNTYRWELDAPMVIPARGDLDFELSTFSNPGFDPSYVGDVQAAVHFEELGVGLFKGAARDVTFPVRRQTTPSILYPADGFGWVTPAQGGFPQTFPPQQKFSARVFGQQNQDPEGSIPITGWSVMLNQRNYDTGTIAAAIAAGGTTTVVAPLGFRIGTRARMRHGGTGAFWWREGAPLALVSPSKTPAQLFELRTPLTLGPGDNLEVEMTVPGPPTIDDEPADSIYQMAVSFCGYAAIES